MTAEILKSYRELFWYMCDKKNSEILRCAILSGIKIKSCLVCFLSQSEVNKI